MRSQLPLVVENQQARPGVMDDSSSRLRRSGCGSLKVRPQFQSRLRRAAIKKEAEGGSESDTVKP